MRLSDELVWVAYESRPDVPLNEAEMLFSLKQGKEEWTQQSGKQIYLKESVQGKGLQLSTGPTDLWMRPLLFEEGSALIEVGRREEKAQFVVGVQGKASLAPSPEHEAIRSLKTGKLFPFDALLQQYGGRELSPLATRTVLEIDSHAMSYAFPVQEGDFLSYEKGEWHPRPLSQLPRSAPLARIVSCTSEGAQVDVWDERGISPLHLTLALSAPPRVPFGEDCQPTSARLRTGTQVSCALGKRRVILKTGDWILKTASGWRHLRGAEEVKLYLNRRLKGELFIIDGIDKSVLRGHLIDATRTVVQPVHVPISGDKPSSKQGRKRRPR
jgi:hypothetical protein